MITPGSEEFTENDTRSRIHTDVEPVQQNISAPLVENQMTNDAVAAGPSDNPQDATPASFCLFLGDLSLFCTEEMVSQAFSVFGEILEVRIKRNKTTKRNLSYGFVEFADATSALNAMNTMNGTLLCGRALR